jgi:ribonuclease HI
VQEKSISHMQGEVAINKDIPWDFFFWCIIGNPSKGGSRGILYLSSNHNISFKVGIGQETNNFCELMALKLVLKLAQEFGVTQLQIFGDSKLVIQWMCKRNCSQEFYITTLV